MKRLRAALSDDAREPRYIETLPRRGARWIAAALRFAKLNSRSGAPVGLKSSGRDCKTLVPGGQCRDDMSMKKTLAIALILLVTAITAASRAQSAQPAAPTPVIPAL